ncbi:dephospho-CoA kinase [Glaciecola sp. XM2]|jgi:dephospho-CoA kinase|uniref:dephospho-CoA kinase n=1 Tax=Glaciecola sp. XM2 TaxID=1914931 RepID=UPI001BDF341E|nr:dephospho-CoA kinase [Glaciecola sp. XM2]MBT1450526.1 dephospho-CoA kinase [Glaciecola sp. XM2]
MSNFVVGVTGGIGSGKTTVTDAFAKLGVTIVDADVIAREVVAPNSEGLVAITKRFGNDILTQDGHLNRTALREHVFSHPQDKQWLDSLLHPLIREQMISQTQMASTPYSILSIPLLVENKLQTLVNRVLVVDVPETVQLKRASARDNADEALIKAIMKNQCSRDQRLAVADDVVDNSNGFEYVTPQVQALHEKYLDLAQQHNT